MTSPASPAPRATTKLTARTPEDVLAVVPVVLGFEPSDSVAMLTFGGVETFHARVDLPPPEEVDEAVEQLLEPALQHRVTHVVFVVYADDRPAARAVLRRLRRAFGRAGIEVVEALRVHDGRWFAPGRPGAPSTGVPFDVGGHVFRAQAVVDGIVVHGSRAELESGLQASPQAVEEVARALRRAVPSPPGEIADLVDMRLAEGRFTPVELARVLLGLLERRGRDAAWAAMSRDDAERHVRLWTDAVQRAPDELVAAPAAVLALAAWLVGPRRACLVCRRPLPGRRPGQHPGQAGRRHAHPRRAAVHVGAGGVVRACTGCRPALATGALGTGPPWTRGRSGSRRSCWSSTPPRGP